MKNEIKNPTIIEVYKNTFNQLRRLYTLTTVARETGISMRHLQYIFNGERPLKPLVRKRLLKYINSIEERKREIIENSGLLD